MPLTGLAHWFCKKETFVTSASNKTPASLLSVLGRLKIGEQLVADASDWLEMVEDDFDDTVLLAGGEAEARALRPALARTLDEARADLEALERALESLRSGEQPVSDVP